MLFYVFEQLRMGRFEQTSAVVKQIYLEVLKLFEGQTLEVEMNQFEFLNFFAGFYVDKKHLLEVYDESTRVFVAHKQARWWQFKYLSEIEGVCGFE